MTRIVRCALPIVLMLAAAPSTFAEATVCHAIRRGESATQAARRLTGDGRNAYRGWFQIMNHSSRFVPKSQYNRIRAGWRACVIGPGSQRTPATADRVTVLAAPDALDTSEASTASSTPEALPASIALAATEAVEVAADTPQSVASDALRTISAVDLTFVWLGAALVVPWFGWRVLDGYLARRKAASIVMRHFAHRFVDEFERPLVRYDVSERPVRSRLRWSARRGRFDILLAPGEGRRYPNLLDHKKNVEYDVSRVMHALADDSFVSGPLYMQSGWVVVPFQFLVRRSRGEGGTDGPARLRTFGASAGQEQPGVTCISSF
jgi:hypothetical protein